uniref:Uncharacterized protein n=1 Tax=Brassica campestris TaxID=3711 RepID=A0A3P6BQF5_BRACM|nr:unnamed protein product [Brassica rapa]
MEGTAGASQLPRVREKGGSNLEAGYLQLPASQRIANHSANHKHELTNQPDIDIHQRHEAVGLSDDAVVRFKTRRLPPSRPSPGPYTPVEPRAYIEQADRTAHHLWSSLNRKLGDGGRHNDGTSNFEASKPPVTRRWPKQHHALPPEQPQSRRETHPLKDSTHFPRRPPEETKTERITRVASNPDLRPRGLPDEPRAAKPKSLTRSKKKNLLDKVAGAKLEVATARSKRRPLASLPSPGTTQIYSINPDLNQERISELHLLRHREKTTEMTMRSGGNRGGSSDRKRTRQPPERGVNAAEES